jgi:hypothetical protein
LIRRGSALVAATFVVTALSAHVDADGTPPPPSRGFVDRLAAAIHAKVDALIIARPPKLTPPTPIKLRYKLAKVATLDIGAPLAALAAADLDGDGRAELYAVTAREVIAIAADKKPRILARIAFAGDAATVVPRDVVASAAIDAGTLLAAASPWQRGMRVRWDKGALVGVPLEPGFPQCATETAQLAPGRNYYGDAQTGHYGVRCASGFVDSDGYALRARAQLSLANKLDVTIERCAAAGLGCQPAARHEVSGVGTAFEVADVDRDGRPELIAAGAGAPGDPDALRIVTLGDDDKKHAKLKKSFANGGIAGVVFADVDGNGTPEVIVASRVAGSPKVELWRVN